MWFNERRDSGRVRKRRKAKRDCRSTNSRHTTLPGSLTVQDHPSLFKCIESQLPALESRVVGHVAYKPRQVRFKIVCIGVISYVSTILMSHACIMIHFLHLSFIHHRVIPIRYLGSALCRAVIGVRVVLVNHAKA